MDSAFVNILRGQKYLGLELDEGAPKYSGDYTYIEVPVREFYNLASDQILTKALRNQHLRIVPACKISAKHNYRVLVKTNPILQEVANCPALFLLDGGQDESASFYATFRRDFDMTELDWCIRAYLVG